VYGSLAGVVALQIWTFCSAIAIFFAAAIAAQLEAVRSGTQTPPRDQGSRPPTFQENSGTTVAR